MSAQADRRARPLALTMGDPAGIGLEITLKAWRDRNETGLPPFVLFGCPKAVEARARATGLAVPVEIVDRLHHGAASFSSRLPVLPFALAASAQPGRPDTANASAVIGAIEAAVQSVLDGEAVAIVTNPIAKSILQKAGFVHPGHTEFLGHLAMTRGGLRHVKPVMMLAARDLRVVPLTIHVPLSTVPAQITRSAIFDTVRIIWEALKRDFAIDAPRIAVAGLNPHAGEDATIGREDKDIIAPAIHELRAEGLSVTGPHSADTLFHEEARKNYDAVLAMYHDQALIPIKTLAFDTGVNVTLGLPFVRTSPDHGTAFDIAGKGIASARSLIESLKLADELASRRARMPADQTRALP